MKMFTFKELPQLQALVFVKNADATLEPGRNYRGPSVAIKLNDEYMVSLSDLLAEKKEDAVRGLVVSPDDANTEVVPVDVGIPETRLHEIIVHRGLGSNLINLDRRR